LNNKILASLTLSIAATIGLTACSSSSTPVSSTEGNSGGSGFGHVACKVIDYATVFSFSSCTSDADNSTATHVVETNLEGSREQEAETSAPETSDSTVETDTQDSSVGKIGEQLVNGGVALTVLKAEVVDSISMNRSGYSDEKDIVYTKDKPSNGGKFIRVDTLVKNAGNTSMDLTCGWPIENKLLDSNERAFDPIDELDLLKGNPQCNANLQPGFETEMTYIYQIPTDASADTFSFREAPLESNNAFTYASLQ